eukprot:maker-scaffold2453_size15579-snap-gene-0.6 protein:Tk07724 transcript:maker-scaffold2453_size15579-snap-gene-0.6-mRNA-1 annotation:"fut10_danre ame: full"
MISQTKKWTNPRTHTQKAWCMASRWSLWNKVWRHSIPVKKLSEVRNTRLDKEPTTSNRAQPKELLQLDWAGQTFDSDVDVPVMLWWDGFSPTSGLKQCGEARCFFARERQVWQHPQTAAVFFYGSDWAVEDGLPLPRRPGVDWALLHEESPKNQMIFNHAPLIRYFNHTATFRKGSDLPLTYQYLEAVASLTHRSPHVLGFAAKTALQDDQDLALVAYVQSNCDNPMQRDEFVEELAKHIKVDAYGACLHNKDLPQHLQGPSHFKDPGFLAFLGQYKFILSLENAVCPDYITEKLWKPLEAGSIPIYLGAPNVLEFAPNTDSAIWVQEYGSLQELADHVRDVGSNETLYNSYLVHKSGQIENDKLISCMQARPWGVSESSQHTHGTFVDRFECLVCTRAHERWQTQKLGFKPEVFRANQHHYGCPFPKSAMEIVGEKRRTLNFWQNLYSQSEVEARVMAQYLDSNKNFSVQEYQKVVMAMGLKDEEQRHQGGKDVLGELGEESHQSGSLEEPHQEGDDHSPNANPDSPTEKVNLARLGEAEQSLVKEQDRSSHSGHDEGLSGEEGKDQSTHSTHNERFGNSDQTGSFIAGQTAKGDGTRETGKVNEDGGGQHLTVQSVSDIGPIPGIALPDVIDHASKGHIGPFQWIVAFWIIVASVTTGTFIRFLLIIHFRIQESLLAQLTTLPHFFDLIDGQEIVAVPVARGKHHGFVEELVDGRQELASLLDLLTGLDMRVEKERPISWKSMSGHGLGVSRMKMNLTGRGTSMALGMMIPSASLTKADTGLVILSRDPTRTMVPSVPALIFRRMFSFLL